MRYGRSDKANDGNLYATTTNDGVRLEIGKSRLHVYGICAQNREVAVAYELVKHLMSRLNVMITNDTHIITDEVHHVSHTMTLGAVIYVVEII